MLNYFVELIVCQALFLGLYQLFKSEPFFRMNRIYLIFSLVLSLVLPLFSFTAVMPFQISQAYIEWLQPVQIGLADKTPQPTFSETQVQAMQGFQWNIYYTLYGAGLLLYLAWFMYRNRLLFNYLNLNSFDDYKYTPIVFLPHSSIAFSFLDRIYMGALIPEDQRQVILEHEYQHIQRKHSWDLLFVEILQFIMWFNPLIYIYKLQLRELHEFEVDHSLTSQFSIKNYINTLLNQSFGSQNVSFVHTFSRPSKLKKRIKMLYKTKKTPFRKLKYLLIIPVLTLATIWSCSQEGIEKTELNEKEQNEQMITFINRVIDKKPYIFDVIKEKPTLEEYLSNYNIEVKEDYSEHEADKVGFLIYMLTVSDQYKSDEIYQIQILDDINDSEGIRAASEKFKSEQKENRIYNKKTETQDISGHREVPFALMDNPPHPSSCVGLTGDELKKCLTDFISNHVSKNFDTTKFKDLKSGKYRVSVQFKIDKNGKVTNIRARGLSPELEAEAIQSIETLPELIPGEVNGEKVGVLYGLPINFIITE